MSAQAWRRSGGERARSPVEIVGAAGRLAQSRAAGAGLRSVELRVFGAVVSLTVMWTKLSDEVYLTQVAELAGIGGSDKNKQRETGQALKRLAELGIITYEPATGRGQRSRIGLPSLVVQKGGSEPTLSNDKTCGEPTERVGQDPPFSRKGWVNRTQKGGQFGREREGNGVPPTEEDPSRPKTPDLKCAENTDELTLDLRAGSEVQEPPTTAAAAADLLAAVAGAAPACCRHELLHDPDQDAGRSALRRRLVLVAAEVGIDRAVEIVAGEWPQQVASAMAHANARARAFLDGPATSWRPGVADPLDPLDGIADATAALAERARAREAELAGEPRLVPPPAWKDDLRRMLHRTPAGDGSDS